MEEKANDQMGKAILLLLIGLLLMKYFQNKIQELGIEKVVNYSTNTIMIVLSLLLLSLSFISKFTENKTSAILRWASLFLILVPLLNISYYSLATYNYPEEIIRTIILLISYAVIFIALIFTYKKIKQKVILNKKQKEIFEKRLCQNRKKNICSFQEFEETQNSFNQAIASNHKLATKYAEEIENIQDSLKKIKQELTSQENSLKNSMNQEKQMRTVEISKHEKEESLKNHLLEYFRIKGNTKTIPESALMMDEIIIRRAKESFDLERMREKKLHEIRQEATSFILKNEAYPSNFNDFDKEEQKIYTETYGEFKKGILTRKHLTNLLSSDDPLLKQSFYHAKDLSGRERNKLIHEYNYRSISFIFLETGKKGNNLLIINDPRKESDYHYCIKQLVHELDKEHSIIEYCEEGKRSDVVFKIKNKTLAVEIETGKNKDLQIENKIDWLNKRFSQWIIICSRKNKKKYDKQIDNKKSFCCTVTEAHHRIKEWLSKPE